MKIYAGKLGPHQPRDSVWLHRYRSEEDIPWWRWWWHFTRRLCGLYLVILGRWYLEWVWMH